MRPGRHDIRLSFLIAGEELGQLKRLTWMMADAFGLDRRIEAYRGVRPIALYRWDADCLLAVMDAALNDRREYPDVSTPGYAALASLYARLRRAYDETFRD